MLFGSGYTSDISGACCMGVCHVVSMEDVATNV
jgi:hypothetical protein